MATTKELSMTPKKITLAGAAALALVTATVGPVAAQQRVVAHRGYQAVRVIEPQARIAEAAQYRPLVTIVGVDY
jgi:hypothetical protein